MKKYLWILCLLLLVISIGCNQNQELSTVFPTKIIEPTKTATPTYATPTPRPTPTYQIIPTIPSTDPARIIQVLLLTNNGCKYPCWWGIVPGVTSWKSVEVFLTPFADRFWYSGETRIYEVHFTVPKEIHYDGGFNVRFYLDQYRVVKKIYTFPKIILADFLQEYGSPDQVYVWLKSYYTLDSYSSYEVVLFYQEQGIMAAFEGTSTRTKNVKVCPGQFNEDYALLWLWNPVDELTFEEVGKPALFQYGVKTFFQLEEVSDFNTGDFYMMYKEAENTGECFEITDPEWID